MKIKNALLICVVFSILSVSVVAECNQADIERVVNQLIEADGQKTRTQLETDKKVYENTARDMVESYLAKTTEVIDDYSKKLTIVFAICILGVLLLVEGALGYFRVRKESNILLMLKEDNNKMKDNIKLIKDKLDIKDEDIKSEG